MIAKLVVTGGKTTKRVVELNLPTVLGRSREADIVVPHPLISRRHCEMFEQDGLLMLRDLSSLNGTTIGGRRIVLAALLPEGEFAIGPVTFRVLYRCEGDPDSAPPTQFVDGGEENFTDDVGGVPMAGAADNDLDAQFDEALAADPASAAHSGNLQMDDFLAMADADPDEAVPADSLPAVPTPPPGPSRKTVSVKTPSRKTVAQQPPASSGESWPPVAHDKLPTIPMPHGNLQEPQEIDSSLESGGHGTAPASPWGAVTPDVTKPRGTKPASPPPFPPATEEGSESEALPDPDAIEPTPAPSHTPGKPAKKAPPKPPHTEDVDPEFGSFLEGLQ